MDNISNVLETNETNIPNFQWCEVLLLRKNVSKYFPPCIPPTLTQGKSIPYNRMGKIIDQIKYFASSNIVAKSVDEDLDKVWREIEQTPDTIFCVEGFDDYYFWYNPIDRCISECKIKGFYNHNYWEIVCDTNYDNYEFVRFYDDINDNFIVLDKDLRYVDGEDKLGVEKHKRYIVPNEN